MIKLEEQMLISAVRYALGRQSYIVSMTCDFVTMHIDKLSMNCRGVLYRDITEEIERWHRMGQTCGMECDERDWMKLLDVLKERV